MRMAVAAAVLFSSAFASAHVQLTYPPARTTNQKLRHCGDNSLRGTNVTALPPGSTITVIWKETIDHPGHFRISFDTDGQDFSIPPDTTSSTMGIDPNVLVDLIPDVEGNKPPDGRIYTQNVTLPNVECDNCTLQLIQLMTDQAVYGEPQGESDDIYYQCADIVLSGSAPDAGVPATDAAAQPGDEAGANPGTGDGGGGCCSTGGGSRSDLGFVLVLSLILRRRTRTQ